MSVYRINVFQISRCYNGCFYSRLPCQRKLLYPKTHRPCQYIVDDVAGRFAKSHLSPVSLPESLTHFCPSVLNEFGPSEHHLTSGYGLISGHQLIRLLRLTRPAATYAKYGECMGIVGNDALLGCCDCESCHHRLVLVCTDQLILV